MEDSANKSQGHLFSGWHGHQREPLVGDVYRREQVSIHFDYAERLYGVGVGVRAPLDISDMGRLGTNG